MNGMPPNAMAPGMEGADFGGQGMGGGVDNKHALQDYQMQLMLLEQQNKKRLLAAKRDNPEPMAGGGLGGSGPPGGFAQAPNMSPSGSRGAGPSPTPNDQMRKVVGTPKMPQQIPESPMGDQNREAPAPNYDPSNPQMAHGVPQQFYLNGNPMARPPSSHPGFQQMTPQLEAQMRMNAARAGQPWPPGAPMIQGVGQPGQPGMPGQRPGTMAPPPVPADQNLPQPRPQESSPAQAPAPPTPSTKSAPKPKKETAAAKKASLPLLFSYHSNLVQKNQTKKGGAAAATPSADNDLPPTPTPSTPNATGQLAKQAAPAPAGPTAPGAQQGMDAGGSFMAGMEDGGLNVSFSLGLLANTNIVKTPGGFSLEFQGIEGSDVFENFDFDNFLNADGGDMSMDVLSYGDGVEAGN
jgi:hypothetical protein